MLQKLKEEQQTAMRSNMYDVRSCPICMEDFETEALRPSTGDN